MSHGFTKISNACAIYFYRKLAQGKITKYDQNLQSSISKKNPSI